MLLKRRCPKIKTAASSLRTSCLILCTLSGDLNISFRTKHISLTLLASVCFTSKLPATLIHRSLLFQGGGNFRWRRRDGLWIDAILFWQPEEHAECGPGGAEGAGGAGHQEGQGQTVTLQSLTPEIGVTKEESKIETVQQIEVMSMPLYIVHCAVTISVLILDEPKPVKWHHSGHNTSGQRISVYRYF